MSLYSCSTMSSSKSNDSYRLSSSSSSLSSITTVSSQINKEEWPAPPEEVIQSEQNMVSNAWQIEKNVSLKDREFKKNNCIVKATMTNGQIILDDPSSTRSKIIPGKHVSMKVVFRL